ncbi:unnamed protein product [Penicillium viridicatum]
MICALCPGHISIGSFLICLASIMSYVVAVRFRRMMYALIGLLVASTQAMAPVVAGALTSDPGWRRCFWISLPIGGTATALVLLGCSIQEPTDRLNGKTLQEHWVLFDWCGEMQYGWTSGSMVALHVLTPIFLGTYVAWQWRAGENALTAAESCHDKA